MAAALLAAALGGAFLTSMLRPSRDNASKGEARPIVQIVRQQPSLPDIADIVDRLCPSVGAIVPHGVDTLAQSKGTIANVPASGISADGWLLTSEASLPQGNADVLFGDGRRADVVETRTDPVSGIAIAKAGDTSWPPPLPFSDQAFPRVGQFAFILNTPAGSGCSAIPVMIGSDFIADGGAAAGYVRLEPLPSQWREGSPLLGADGRIIGVGTSEPGTVIPASIASVIVDELIRNNLSPSTAFGFRAIDYPAPLSARLGNSRSGAGIALVQPKSAASRAGLQAGDIVSAVDDVPIASASELGRALDAQSGSVTLTVQRESRKLHLSISRTNRH